VSDFGSPTSYVADSISATQQAGAYFVTIVTHQRECIFGEIMNGETPQGGNVVLNDLVTIADECWRAIPDHFDHVDGELQAILLNKHDQ
jgi:putative transposase